MSKSRTLNRVSAPLLTGLLSCSAYSIYAQSASENYGLIANYGGQLLAQGNAAVNGSQALMNNSCAPTAVANGLSYLQAYGYSTDNNPFSTSPNSYATVNSLQTSMGTDPVYATSGAGALSGTQTWLANNPTSPTVGAFQVADPSGAALANVLSRNDGVQLGILWSSVANPIANDASFTPQNGGHFVSLDSISLTSGSGTIGIVDPWGNGVSNGAGGYNASTTPTQDTLDVSTVTITAGGVNSLPAGTYLEVSYADPSPLGDFPSPPEGTAYAGAGGTGLIALDQVETLSSVPEPSSFVMSALATAGFGGFVYFRRRKN